MPKKINIFKEPVVKCPFIKNPVDRCGFYSCVNPVILALYGKARAWRINCSERNDETCALSQLATPLKNIHQIADAKSVFKLWQDYDKELVDKWGEIVIACMFENSLETIGIDAGLIKRTDLSSLPVIQPETVGVYK